LVQNPAEEGAGITRLDQKQGGITNEGACGGTSEQYEDDDTFLDTEESDQQATRKTVGEAISDLLKQSFEHSDKLTNEYTVEQTTCEHSDLTACEHTSNKQSSSSDPTSESDSSIDPDTYPSNIDEYEKALDHYRSITKQQREYFQKNEHCIQDSRRGAVAAELKINTLYQEIEKRSAICSESLDQINGLEVRVHQLRHQLEHQGEQGGDSTQGTEVLIAVQSELENKKQQIRTLNLNFQKSVSAFTTELDAHQATTTAFGVAAQALLAANLNDNGTE